MNIETVHDLAEHIADIADVYGSCQVQAEGGNDCRLGVCRVCFVPEMEDRIRAAVENDRKLSDAGIA